mgnify:CR=1 FL=1
MDNSLTIDGFEIATHYGEGIPNPWIAVNMTVARERLSGYNLSELEKTDLGHLLAGYCRLIDEYQLDGYGDTEFEAIQHLFSKATPHTLEGE